MRKQRLADCSDLYSYVRGIVRATAVLLTL